MFKKIMGNPLTTHRAGENPVGGRFAGARAQPGHQQLSTSKASLW